MKRAFGNDSKSVKTLLLFVYWPWLRISIIWFAEFLVHIVTFDINVSFILKSNLVSTTHAWCSMLSVVIMFMLQVADICVGSHISELHVVSHDSQVDGHSEEHLKPDRQLWPLVRSTERILGMAAVQFVECTYDQWPDQCFIMMIFVISRWWHSAMYRQLCW